jgi:hypothetical protein
MLEKGKVYRRDAGSGASEYIFCETDGGLTAYGKGLSVTIMPSGEIVTIKPNRYFSVSEVMVQRDAIEHCYENIETMDERDMA